MLSIGGLLHRQKHDNRPTISLEYRMLSLTAATSVLSITLSPAVSLSCCFLAAQPLARAN